ncbi:dihydroorotase [Thermodesulfovibrionales bacterium]|nr:dihydroorotase [Thermodesulfovibrionales bacterium]MCL0070955.1 dihydroorotase [Thermodesulfovibrionales bacterium]
MKILIAGGHIIDPSQGIDEVGDILIEGGKIREVRCHGKAGEKEVNEGRDLKEGRIPYSRLTAHGLEIIDSRGMFIMPGLLDMHTHLREPGFEYKETIKTGTKAAIQGGFTSVCCMANTYPINDSATVAGFILKKAAEEGSCSVYPIGAITKGQRGDELAELGMMFDAGCVAFSDDGSPVMGSLIMRRALEYSKIFDIPIISHCEDLTLSGGGLMNEGRLSILLGLRGIPAASEEIMVARDIILSELTKGRLHIAHVSTEGSLKLIRDAKDRGINITAETCPHYFSLPEGAVGDYNTDAKVNPPLRTERDVTAIKEGLREGVIDVIATDHAPHHRDEKLREFEVAPFGISGLETALPLSLKLVSEGVLTMPQLVERMALNPARILKIDKGTLKVGSDADIVILDTNREFKVEAEKFASMGKNTPFDGWILKGRAVVAIYKGKVNNL